MMRTINMDEFNEDHSLISPLHQDDLENELVDVEFNQEAAQHTLRESFSEIVQLANFQLTDEVIRNSRRGQRQFDRKEIKASLNWRRQICSLSTLLVVIQVSKIHKILYWALLIEDHTPFIVLLVIMIQKDGYTNNRDNPYYGPPVETLVLFGAKESGLIVYRNEWWRLLTSVMLHGGIIHIVPNALLQLFMGGYLILIFGHIKYLAIFFSSGVYGQIASCLFLPSTVGVGSSGAIMGILGAWAVWIIYRWDKVPPSFRGERNCQLTVICIAIVLVLGTSVRGSVDFGAHFGGALQGVLCGLVLLSSELDHRDTKRGVRILCALGSLILFTISIVYMCVFLHPTKASFDTWDENDHW